MIYPYSIKVRKCNGNCNNMSNPYSKVCVPNIIKNFTLRISDLMTLTNKTTNNFSCKCVCRLGPIVCNNKQNWNENKCKCECLIDKKCSDNKFWNSSNCKCELKKSSLFIIRRM